MIIIIIIIIILFILFTFNNFYFDMKNNKAPDPDSIPIEFFKAFFNESDLSDNQRHFFRCSLL